MAKFKDGELVIFKESKNVYEIEYSYEEYGNTIYVFKDTKGMICRYEDALESVGDITIEGEFKGYTNQEMIDRIEKAESLLKNSAPKITDAFDIPYEKASETQVAGNHYSKLKIQPMEYCLQNNLNYGQSNAIKYITRYKDKNGIEDLKKAIHCIELLMEFEEK